MKLKGKTYRWELNARYNYWIEYHGWQAVALLCTPYGLTIFSSLIVGNAWPAILSLLWLPYIIFLILIRDNDVMNKFQYPMDNYEIRNNFLNKWIRRSKNQFIYFDTINDFNANIHIYNIEPSLFEMAWSNEKWDNYSKYENATIHNYSMDGSRLATEEEIEEYKLYVIEAKLLLNNME